MSALLNEQPTPTIKPTKLPTPRPVWVACLWDMNGERVKELVPATATHRVGELVLCDFYDPRCDSRQHWMPNVFVRDREIKHAEHHGPIHPAAAPSPVTDIGS